MGEQAKLRWIPGGTPDVSTFGEKREGLGMAGILVRFTVAFALLGPMLIQAVRS